MVSQTQRGHNHKHSNLDVNSNSNPILKPSADSKSSVLECALHEFSKGITSQELSKQAIAMEDDILEALKLGLSLCMLPHHSVLPTGKESGDYLVLDLGGSTLRVAVISIRPHSSRGSPNKEATGYFDGVHGKPREVSSSFDTFIDRSECINIIVSKQWEVANSNKVVDRTFFEMVASKIAETVRSQTVLSLLAEIPVGVTWSFPLENLSYNNARILLMGKGYELSPELRGADLKTVLEQTVLTTQGIQLNIEAIVNDSFTVYVAGKFFDPNTELALVLGTGFNMCYDLTTSPEFHSDKTLGNEPKILFNTEMSFFGAGMIDLFITKYDIAIDSRFAKYPSFSPHMCVDPKNNTIFQPCELLSSGRYIVELVRLVLMDLIENKEIFSLHKDSPVAISPYEGITGLFMSQVIAIEDDLKGGSEFLELFFGLAQGLVTETDVVKLISVVMAVVKRSAAVVSVAIIASLKLLAHRNGLFTSGEVTVGYAGAVMQNLRPLRVAVTENVNNCKEIKDLGVTIKLRHAHDSSLVGGAIAAAFHLLYLQGI